MFIKVLEVCGSIFVIGLTSFALMIVIVTLVRLFKDLR